MKTAAERTKFMGEEGVGLQCDPYSAVILPKIGGNLISFRHEEKGLRFLREPEANEMPLFKERPIKHGIPVLFPPNRYDKGIFQWDGCTYHLPINEPSLQNHNHGFLFQRSWNLSTHLAGNMYDACFLV